MADVTKQILQDDDETAALREGAVSDDFTFDNQESKDARGIAITRLVVAIVTIINVIAGAFGWQPLGIDGELIYTIVSGIMAVLASIWAWWKNNNMTVAAQTAQYALNEIKAGNDVKIEVNNER